MEPKGLLPSSQEPDTDRYPEPNKSNPILLRREQYDMPSRRVVTSTW
jgi:hypothetical protein